MEQRKGFRTSGRLFSISLVGIAALSLAGYYRNSAQPADYRAYWIDYEAPAGWKNEKSGALYFYFVEPKSNVIMKAVMTHGLPGEIDGNKYTSHEVANNLMDGINKGKTAKMRLLGDFKEGKEVFTMVRRDLPNKSLINAFACKGVTTVSLEISAEGAAAKEIERYVPELQKVMKSIDWIAQPLPAKNAKEIEAIPGPPPLELLRKNRA